MMKLLYLPYHKKSLSAVEARADQEVLQMIFTSVG